MRAFLSRFAGWFWLVLLGSSIPIEAANLDVRSFGAKGDGATTETAAIQKAIDTCSQQGGGKVTFPAGRYVTGTILLKDNVTLHLDADSTILGSTHIDDYTDTELFTEGTGQKMGWCLIGSFDAKNIGIEGPGTIDGRGRELNAARPPGVKKRPVLLRLVRSDSIALSHLQLRSSAMWMVHFSRSSRIKVESVHIENHVAGNNDGIDIDSCDGVQIANCQIDSDDDAICLKSTHTEPSRNISVTGCTLKSRCATIKMGTESLGGFQNVSITNCHVLGAGYGGINVFSVDGGDVSQITISDIQMEKVQAAIVLRLGSRLRTFHEGDVKKSTGTMRGITIKNITCTRADLTGILISGVPDHRIENVVIENVQITVLGGGRAEDAALVPPEKEAAYPESRMFGNPLPAYGIFARHVQGLTLTHCQITPAQPDARPWLYQSDVADLRQTP